MNDAPFDSDDPPLVGGLAFDGRLAAAAAAVNKEDGREHIRFDVPHYDSDDPPLIGGLAFDGRLAAAAATANKEEGREHVRFDVVPHFDSDDRPRIGDLGAANMEEGREHVRVDVPHFDAAAFSSTPARFDDDLCFPRLGAAKMVDVPYSDKAASASPFKSVGLSGSAGYFNMQSPIVMGRAAPGHGDAVPFAATPSSGPGVFGFAASGHGDALPFAATALNTSSGPGVFGFASSGHGDALPFAATGLNPSSGPGVLGFAASGHGDAVPYAATGLNRCSAPGIVASGLNTAATGFVSSSMGRSTLNPNAPSFEPAAIPASSASVFTSFSAIEDDFLSRSAKSFSHPLPSNPPTSQLTMPVPKAPADRPTLSARFPVTGGRKTVLCKFWANAGSCARGANCTFAHGLQDMMRVDPNVFGSEGKRVSYNRRKYKTRPCWYWKPGVPMSCTLGLYCLFAHGSQELRRP